MVDSAATIVAPFLGMVAFLLLLVSVVGFAELARWSHADSVTDTSVRFALRDTPAAHAEALLRDVLEPQEYAQLSKHAYLDVKSPSVPERFYRIPGYLGLVRVYEHGVPVQDLCIQPVESLPSADIIAMHKLMIQGAEQEYLARARQFALK